ncbi:MAG: hypothetical protein WDW38_003201 [Sanguina aurantia]
MGVEVQLNKLDNGLVTLSLAEVASACPSIGGLYYYSARLAPQAYKGVAGFMTAHCNIMGVLTSVAFIILQLAGLLANIRYAVTFDDTTGTGQLTDRYQMFYLYMGIVLSMGLLGSVSGRVVSYYCSFALYLSLITFLSLSLALLIMAPTHNSGEYVFVAWQDHSRDTGIRSSSDQQWVSPSSLPARFSVNVLTGWDTTIYMTEEVLRPTYTVPAAMLRGFCVVTVMGAASVVMLLFSIQNPGLLLSSAAVFGGTYPVSQAMWDITQERLGSGSACAPFMVLVAMGLFLMSLFLFLGISRKLYGMSRDRLMIGCEFWSVLNPWLLIPLRSVWATALALLLLGLTLLADDSAAAFSVVTAQNVPLTLTSYLLPIAICLFTRERLQPGPWNMGRWGPLVRGGAVAYLAFILVLVMLPASYPITVATLPFAPIMWLGCLMAMQGGCWWLPKIGGRHYYQGPVADTHSAMRFAITSPVLVPWARPFSFWRAVRCASPSRNRRPKVRPCSGDNTGAAVSTEPEVTSGWVYTGWLWERLADLVPLGRISGDMSEGSRGSPNTFFRQPALRIPGENEALSRARKLPVHPSGYAWDREAARRLGHRDVGNSKPSYSPLVKDLGNRC